MCLIKSGDFLLTSSHCIKFSDGKMKVISQLIFKQAEYPVEVNFTAG